MKNGNDNLKEKAIKANELENISGGEKAWPEKHPLDKSNYETQSEKGINVKGGEQLSLDKLKDTSGGSQATTSVKYVIDVDACRRYKGQRGHSQCDDCFYICDRKAVICDGFGLRIDPNLCNGCGRCFRWYGNDYCKAFKQVWV